jgi:serine beta-lactamase-like protein LACTB
MHTSRRLLPVACLLLLSVSAATRARFDDVDRIAAEGHKQTGAPGMSVALVLDDQLVWSKGFGLADVENNVPARPDTVYRIASISKTIAATAVMQLVERGRVQLDDPIQKYVPAFPSKGEQTITIRHLLTHTSGIRHYREGEMESRDAYQTVAEAMRVFKDDPLLFAPGTKYSYSTYGFNLLAGVVEIASGVTYEEYLRQHVWGPAGMRSTYFDHPDAIIPHRARQYVRADSSVHNAPYADLSIKWAGGGVLSTAEDLARFHIALDRGILLKPDTMSQMYAPARLTDGTVIDYGLGWRVWKDARGHAWIGHSGGATGGTTFLLRDPARKLAVAVLCNIEDASALGALAEKIAVLAESQVPKTNSQGSKMGGLGMRTVFRSHPSTSVK